MVTLNMLDAEGASRLHRKLAGVGRACEDHVTRRRYRMQWRVYMYLYKARLGALPVA